MGTRASTALASLLVGVLGTACSGSAGDEPDGLGARAERARSSGAAPRLRGPSDEGRAELTEKLVAASGAASDELGSAVAAAGDTVIVGAPYDDELGQDAGAAYVFVRSGASWIQQQKLLAPGGAAGDRFGVAVALSGDTAVVGAYWNDDLGSNAGAAHVFARDGAAWAHQQDLTADDGDEADWFGAAVAIDGDTIVVGAPWVSAAGANAGAAHVFTRSGSAWTEQQRIIPADAEASDEFGTSVAISGDALLVGAPNDDDQGAQAGAAYVFVREGVSAAWTEAQKLAGPAAQDLFFGSAVALSGDTALVGAPNDDSAAPNAGAAYVFVRSGVTWTQEDRLLPASPDTNTYFGASVAIEGDRAVVGAPQDSDAGASSAGAVTLFERAGGLWAEAQKLVAADAGDLDQLGAAVAIAGSTIVAGAPNDDAQGQDAGAAYLFSLELTTSDGCTEAAECASGFCVDGVCCDAACGGGDPDDCQACSVAAGAAADGTCAPITTGAQCGDEPQTTGHPTCPDGDCEIDSGDPIDTPTLGGGPVPDFAGEGVPAEEEEAAMDSEAAGGCACALPGARPVHGGSREAAAGLLLLGMVAARARRRLRRS